MSSAKLTLITMNNFMLDIEDDLFKYLRLPEGIDKDTLTGNILLKGGEFEAVYSDPVFIQNSISIWSSKWYRTFDKWVKALNIEYNPLENYDRMEDWTDNRKKKNTGSVNSSQTDNGSTSYNEQVDDTTKDTTDIENKTSAYDSGSYQPHDKSDTTYNSRLDHDTTGSTSSNNRSTGNSTSTGNEDEDYVHSGRLHGNIGVTTSQQMLESELAIAEWNLYEHITDLFLSEYVIPIYS